jgi:AcrR family transcriptional regulator
MVREDDKRLVAGRPRDPAIDKEIVEAALALFLAQGVEGVSFEQISKRTGIARPTIYRRWKTRRDLLDAAIQSARVSDIRDFDTISHMSAKEFLRFLEDTIVAGLMNPVVPKLVTRLIGALASHPQLLRTYCQRTLEPGWRTLFAAVDRGRTQGALRDVPDNDLLREILVGGVIHHLVFRTGRPTEGAERAWVKCLMRRAGLTETVGSRQKPRAEGR